MIRTKNELIYTKEQINKLENIVMSLKEKLLPERESQYNAMAGIYIKKIESFRKEVDDYLGVSTYKTSNIDLHMHIEGPSIGYGSVPSSLIASCLERFKKGLQGIYVTKNDIKLNRNTPKDIRDICDLRLVNFQPGSINLSFEVPKQQISLDRESIDNSIQVYFDLINWISSDDDNYISNLDKDKLEKLMQSVVNTLPDNKNINKITFSGKSTYCKNKITVDTEIREKIVNKIMDFQIKDEIVSIKGIVRGMDLDKRTLALRDVQNYDKKEINCKLSDDIGNDLKEYLDATVSIKGVKKESYINVKYIENVE